MKLSQSIKIEKILIETEYIIVGVIVLLILLVLYRSNKSKFKGAKGESRVASTLKRLHRKDFKVFNDVILSTRYGSSQIDHIIISIYGIFVIETKNYSGWIHGNDKSEYWTQSIYRKKTKFRNPVKQNWAHVMALKEVFSDTIPVTYHPIVVFTGSAKLKNVYSDVPVIYKQQLIQTIKDKSRTPSLSVEVVDFYTEILHKIIKQNRITKRDHIRQVKRNVRERKRIEKVLVCPKCAGALVIRKGKYGKFYGCSNYPNCRYTRRIGTR